MRLNEFVNQPENDQELIAKSEKYIAKSLSSGIMARSAVLTMVNMLTAHGVEYNKAAEIAKQAYANISNGGSIA